MGTDLITPITHSDAPWAVQQRIEKAPPQMLLRELVCNAVEAAERTEGTKPRIEIRPYTWGGVRKLLIYNTGPGMSADELLRLMDLAESGDYKQQSRQGNYGVGAKLVGLASNPIGMRYRSCHAGTVSECLIGLRAGVYGKIRQLTSEGYSEVVDATDLSTREGRSANYDWTEVVLLGSSEDQDTFLNPYGLGPAADEWAVQEVNRRFYDLTTVGGVRCILAGRTRKNDGGSLSRIARGARWIDQRALRVEEVPAKGVRLRFHLLRDPSKHSQSQVGYSAHICLVWRGECFGVLRSYQWRKMAARFGMPHGQGRIAIHILLPDDHPVEMSQYREALHRSDDPERAPLLVHDFEGVVAEHLPLWVIEHVAECAPEVNANSRRLKDRLREIRKQIELLARDVRLDPAGLETLAVGGAGDWEALPSGGGSAAGQSLPGGEPAKDRPGESRAVAGDKAKRGKWPAVEFERMGAEVQRAARYDAKLNTIFVNLDFERWRSCEDLVAQKFPHVRDQSQLRSDALQRILDDVCAKCFEHVASGLVWRGREAWTSKDLTSAFSEEALTALVTNDHSTAASVSASLSQNYGVAKGRMAANGST